MTFVPHADALLNDDVLEPEPIFEGSPKIDHGDKAAAWKTYDAAVRNAAGYTDGASAREFETNGVFFGLINEEVAEAAYRAVHSSSREPLINADYTPGYTTHEFPPAIINESNRASGFRHFDRKAIWAIEDAFEAMKDDVAAALGTPWRTLNVRAWTSRPASAPKGGYGWHSDGYVREIFKVLLYLTPLSPETGTVEFRVAGRTLRRRTSQRGAWALFKNTEVIHRGVAGSMSERLMVDITLCRAATFDLRARFPGQNAHWPAFPWRDEITGCATDDLHRAVEAGDAPSPFPVAPARSGVLRRLFAAR